MASNHYSNLYDYYYEADERSERMEKSLSERENNLRYLDVSEESERAENVVLYNNVVANLMDVWGKITLERFQHNPALTPNNVRAFNTQLLKFKESIQKGEGAR